ncbi:Leucine-rich repeat domain superfamily [Sesbania bispinosa]|nr:Leucine-rich repeat domain superfamily [Sesbania bispinosa]
MASCSRLLSESTMMIPNWLELPIEVTANILQRLGACDECMSNKGMCEVAKKLPLLEELDISYFNLSKDTFEAIGQCCPLLKVLKLDTRICFGIECDGLALAFAKTMSNLRHLQIWGNKLCNVGLSAIVDGCPLLESLDLRFHIYFVLDESLEKRFREQIKDL